MPIEWVSLGHVLPSSTDLPFTTLVNKMSLTLIQKQKLSGIIKITKIKGEITNG